MLLNGRDYFGICAQACCGAAVPICPRQMSMDDVELSAVDKAIQTTPRSHFEEPFHSQTNPRNSLLQCGKGNFHRCWKLVHGAKCQIVPSAIEVLDQARHGITGTSHQQSWNNLEDANFLLRHNPAIPILVNH